MDLYFYRIKEDYINFLKQSETNGRGFTCVPNVKYWNTTKFTFGSVLDIDGKQYFVPVSSYNKPQQDLILIKDKKNQILGSLRFAYMIPVPKSCLTKLDINAEKTEYARVHISKELAFCRRNREKIQKQAQKTYYRVIENVDKTLTRNSCDFKLLEQAYIAYCRLHNIELPKILQDMLNQTQHSANIPKPEAKTGTPRMPFSLLEQVQKKPHEPSERNGQKLPNKSDPNLD